MAEGPTGRGAATDVPHYRRIQDPDIRGAYDLLGILDVKTAALLTFNALFITGLSVWLGYLKANILHLILDLCYLATLLSCFFLLRVIFVKWSRDARSPPLLAAVHEERTRAYTLSWRLSATSVVVVTGVSVIHTIGTALNVFGACGAGCRWFFSPDIFGNVDYLG